MLGVMGPGIRHIWVCDIFWSPDISLVLQSRYATSNGQTLVKWWLKIWQHVFIDFY